MNNFYLHVCLLFTLVLLCSGEYLTKKHYEESDNFTTCDPATDGDSIYKYSAKLLNNKTLNFSSLKGKVILVLNVATFCQSETEYPMLNQLKNKFGDKLAIVAFPSDEFLNQEPDENYEILDSIKYSRPGNGFVPKFNLTEKVLVNGGDLTHPVFDFLKRSCPSPNLGFHKTNYYVFNPQHHSRDIRWNFEKFLIDPTSGQPLYRFRTEFFSNLIEPFIQKLIKN